MTMKFTNKNTLRYFNKILELCFKTILLITIFVSHIYAQQDTIYVPSDILPSEGSLNRAVDSVSLAGLLSNTVFKLELNGVYVLSDSILVPVGEHLTIIAPEPGTTQETAQPQILWTSNNDVNKDYFIYCMGNLTLKNLWILCADTEGNQLRAYIVFTEDNDDEERWCHFENVILDYFGFTTNAGGAITVACTDFNGAFKNCYWKNCTDNFMRYFGRAVAFPFSDYGWHINSLTFENCTFANIGSIYGQESGNYIDQLKFNHCTFLNVVIYPFESGAWYKMSVTNSIFLNTYMFGDIPLVSENNPDGGTLKIDSIKTFGFEVPFTEQDRRILFTNSSYSIEKWLSDWMYFNPYSQYLRNDGRSNLVPVPQPMLNSQSIHFFNSVENGEKLFPYLNKTELYYSEPEINNSPTDSSAIKDFLITKWDGSGSLHSWAWKPENSINRLWPLEENLAYTNDTLITAGMGGFPLGDLYRWCPEKYEQWKLQEEAENDTINKWLNYGLGTATDIKEQHDIPSEYKLFQNYPNPFNPVTNISYSLPEQAYVKIKVFDVLGREVAELVNETKHAGKHEVIFDGSKLSSGVYFYSIKTNKFSDVKKLVLLR